MNVPAQALLTVAEAAKYLGVSANTLRRWDSSGIFAPQRTPGGQRRYSTEQLDEFIKRQENTIFHNNTPQPPTSELTQPPKTSQNFPDQHQNTSEDIEIEPENQQRVDDIHRELEGLSPDVILSDNEGSRQPEEDQDSSPSVQNDKINDKKTRPLAVAALGCIAALLGVLVIPDLIRDLPSSSPQAQTATPASQASPGKASAFLDVLGSFITPDVTPVIESNLLRSENVRIFENLSVGTPNPVRITNGVVSSKHALTLGSGNGTIYLFNDENQITAAGNMTLAGNLTTESLNTSSLTTDSLQLSTLFVDVVRGNDGNLYLNGTTSYINSVGVFTGNGSALTSLNAANISSGKLNDDRLNDTVSKLGSKIDSAEIEDGTIQKADIASDTIDLDNIGGTLTLDENMEFALGNYSLNINANGTGAFQVNLPETGDFVIKNDSLTYFTFADDGTLTQGSTAGAILFTGATTISSSGGLTLSNTSADLTFGNGETINNDTDGTLALVAATTNTSGNLTVSGTSGLTFNGTGGDITFTNGEKIDNDTDGTLALTAPTVTTSAALTVANVLTVTAGGATITAGNLGVGQAAQAQSLISTAASASPTSGVNQYGAQIGVTVTSAATTNGNGVYANLTGSNTGTYTTTNMSAFSADSITKGTSQTITNLRGLWIQAQNAVATTAYGVAVDAITSTGTTNYGVYIAAPSGASTNYGLYNAGSSLLVGHVGIGSTATVPTAGVISIAETFTDPSGGDGLLNVTSVSAVAGANANNQRAELQALNVAATNTQNWTAALQGNASGLRAIHARFAPQSGATGTITGASGVGSDIRNNAAGITVTSFANFLSEMTLNSGTVTNRYGYYFANGTGTMTNQYGVYIEAPTGAATTNIGLFNAGMSSLQGVVLVGQDGVADGIIRAAGTTGNLQLQTNSTTRLHMNATGLVSINDSANANMTIGLTINQAANDDEIFALKSSDVAHGVTDYAETDTFASLYKISGTDGGLLVRGFSEATIATTLQAIGTTDNTTKSTSGTAYATIDVYKKSGTSVTSTFTASTNLFGIRGGTTTEWLVDAEGDVWQNGGLTILQTGLTVTAGGATITAGNLGIGVAQNAAYGILLQSSALTGTAQRGVSSLPIFSSAATTSGIALEAQVVLANASFTMTDGYGVYVNNASKLGGTATLTNNYGIRVAAQTAGGTANYGAYIEAPSGSATDVGLYVAGGDTGLIVAAGGQTITAGGLTVTAGNLGVGGAVAANLGVRITGTTLSGSTVQVGVSANPTLSSAATGSSRVFDATVITEAAAFTASDATGFYVGTPLPGAGSAITNERGLWVRNQGTTGVTNAYGVYIDAQSGAATTNIGLYNAGTTTLVGAVTGSDLLVDNGFGAVIGHSSQQTFGSIAEFQVLGTTSGVDSTIGIGHWSADANGARLAFAKSRNAAIGSATVVQSGDNLGEIFFYGDDGSDYNAIAAGIYGAVDGTPGANDMPGRLVFLTTADGAQTVSERMRINTAGEVIIGDGTTTNNANLTLGLTIDQRANDDQLLAFKSSDVAHGMTSDLETDSFADFRKFSGTDGGFSLRGFADTGTTALFLRGAGVTDNTTKSASGRAYVETEAAKKNGTSSLGAGADANLFGIRDNAAGTMWLADVEGDTWQEGTLTAEITAAGSYTKALCWDNAGESMIQDCVGTVEADYMEMYSVEEGIEYGDLVAPGDEYITTIQGQRVAKLSKSTAPYQSTLMGVISNKNAAGDFNSIGYNIKEEDNPQPVALVGRILVKVNTENGPILKGDYITSSSTPGIGMKATRPGNVVGQALEDLEEGQVRVMVYVKPTFADPTSVLANLRFDESGNLFAPNLATNRLVILNESEGSLDQDSSPSQAQDQNDNGVVLASTDSEENSLISDLSAQVALLNEQVDLLQEITMSASGSAFLSPSLASESAALAGDLLVGGRTTLGDVGITGTLSAGLITMNGLAAEIHTITGPLKFQESGLNTVEFIAGKIVFDTNGTISAKAVTTEKLSITNSAGTVTIPSGQTEVSVETDALTADSLIFTTPERPVAVGSKKEDENTLRITIPSAESEDLKINWWIIN